MMKARYDLDSEIVISGISGRFPNSENLDEFWENLVQGNDMISDSFDRYNCDEFNLPSRLGILKNLDRFDAGFFALHGKQAAVLDPRLRFLLETTYEAIVDAGINPVTIQGTQTGVFLAASEGESCAISKRTGYKINQYAVLGNVLSMLANRLSYNFDFRGPSYVVDTACSTSSVAIQQAIYAIRSGLCDAAVVAGVHTQQDPVSSFCFHHLKMTSPDGKCKVFDASADGYVRAEAVVTIYICKKQFAKRAYATLVHAITNNDGYTEQGITFPSVLQQERVMRQVYEDCGVNPLEVGYIEAHGTGTKVGDPEEIKAITKVFCDGRQGLLLVGSVKSNMGHPETVAGLCALAKVILAHAAGILPANLHYVTPNPDIPSIIDGRVQVVDRNVPFNARYVGMNSMGFGGTNVHLLLELLPKKQQATSWNPPTPIILLCSGRTQEAVETFLEKALIHRNNQQLVRLTQELIKQDTPRHDFRGYVIVEQDKMEVQVDKRDSGRSMWFIFTGLGSQWAGMSRDLIKYDVFKRSIERSAVALLNNHFDIISLLECGDSTKFEDFKNSVVSITTIQIALVDLLQSIGVVSDGIIGHSTGEVAAGYADGCLTQDQAVLTSYARVRAVLESNLQPGIVASVGITWEDAKTRCPTGIYPAIHNGEKNVTIAGSPDAVKTFIKELESEGIFVKLVRSASFGFHSPLVEESGRLAKILLEKIIPNPKARSKKWLSSSVPEDRWGTDLAKYCSSDYYVNNGVNPVYFYPTLLHVPDNAIVLEIAPHCFMQTILKQSLPKNVVKLGLIHVKSPDNCQYFLDSIGKCYLAGVNLDIATLYEPVDFPMTPDTPNISSMIRWDHSETYNIPHHKNENSQQKGFKYNVSIASEHEAFLEGHSIDGKIVYPATGYLYLAWRSFAKLQESNSDQLPIVFEDVRFDRVTLLSNRSDTEFLVNIFPGNGQFEISQNDMTVCLGVIRTVDESLSKEMLKYEHCDEIDRSGPVMNKDDFYKEMHLRGYGHSGIFQGIETADMGGKWATVKWQGEWISFLDAVIQTFLLRNEGRDLFVPIRLQKVTIDPIEVKKALAENENFLNVSCWETLQSGTCPGMELRGINFAKFNQRSRQPQPSTVEQIFLPYLGLPKTVLTASGALEASLEIAIENSNGSKFTIAEILKNPANMISHLVVNQCMVKFPSVESRLVNESTEVIEEDQLTAGMTNIVTLKDLQSREQNLITFVDDESSIAEAAGVTLTGGFILFKGLSNNVTLLDITLISEKSFPSEDNSQVSYYLYRKLPILPTKIQVVNIGDCNFNWVDTAKQILKNLPDYDRVYFTSSSALSGIMGFVKCLVREVTSEKVRCFHAIGTLEMHFDQPSEILRSQIQNDLLFNVYKDGVWGTLSNISIPREEFRREIPTTVAYANALTLGELSSLSWIQSPLQLCKDDLVEVYYSALNFRDIMLASGKLAQDAVAECYERSDCVLGLEFSGIFQGRRVFGTGLSECLASRIDPTKLIMMDVPNEWTLAEAATVPCVYATVFLALILRGKMQPGESILIHAGSGGVGQAAIQVALSMNCRVYTTVSTTEKRDFLKSRFPKLTDECFANSRDASDFESNIKLVTKGRGVDLVLNCLAQDKLYASIRCLATNGRFLEIGKFDIFNDTKLGMSMFSKGISAFGILADQTFNQGSTHEAELLKEFLQDGMTTGKIKPLSYHVFQHNQLEESFRFMAQGKHIGKVLIQVREDDNAASPVLALPRTYFPPEKSYVIIGGLGGMGFELANWMVHRGARKLVLTSRSGVQSTYHKYHLDVWNRRGVKIIVDQSDASEFQGAKSVLENALSMGTIGGVFHVAVVLKDALLDNLTQADFEDVIKCKADATMNLDNLSRQLAPQLDYFVVFSSIVSARGNPGQTNYGYANSVMERICEQRKTDGLPALAIQWGAVGDVGVFHRTMKDKKVFGLAPQSLTSCLETLDLYLQQHRTVVSSYVPYTRSDIGKIDPNDSLVNIAANILGIKDVKKVNPKTPLVDLGMDSLMAAELSQALQSRTSVQLSQKEYTLLTFERLAELDAKAASSGGASTEQTTIVEKQLNLKRISTQAVTKMVSLSTSPEIIFIVHPMDGTLIMLEELVGQIEANVYGIESVKQAPLDSIERLASFYLNQIKDVQEHGPYKIAGYSFGSTVAFEMVRQLEAQQETVTLLLLLDGSPRVKHYLEKIDDAESRRQDWENKVIFGCLSLYKTNMSVKEYKDISELQTWEEKQNYGAQLLHEAYPHIEFQEVKELIGYFMARALCFQKYDATGKVKARTVLVKALRSDLGEDVPYDYGLSEICENMVEVIEIEGNHYCFYEKPKELQIPSIINKIIS